MDMEGLIVLQLLCDSHPRKWSRTELVAKLGLEKISELEVPLAGLEEHGLACQVSTDVFTASPAARRMDELGLVSV
jgi:hypothetical protein